MTYDHEAKSSYSVTVKQTGNGHRHHRRDHHRHHVSEAPEMTGQASINYAENGTEPVHTYAPPTRKANSITWSVTGADSSAFSTATER